MRNNDHQTLVNQQFSEHALAYLASSTHADGEDLQRMADLVAARPPGVALDLGCGAGHVAFRLSPLAQQVVAYDLSSEMLAVVEAEAQRRGLPNIASQVGTVDNLPFADAMFDWVVTRHSAHHWRHIVPALTEMRRVLRPNGTLLLMDVVGPGLPLLDTWLQSLEVLRDPSHVRDRSLAEWHSLLAAAGFRTVSLQKFRRRLAFGPWIARMQTPPAQVAAIRSLQHIAPQEVADYFALEADGSFTGDTVLIAAEIAAGRS
ncbi:class I SAM-dependent methyltransferase [Methylomonas sp. HW2-6]|uniref:class I SAM-dependent methyltransferase n=1 Tax=Methylomonas sp. HW2-6 TaxID=3376687 RepID=UPI004041A44B